MAVISQFSRTSDVTNRGEPWTATQVVGTWTVISCKSHVGRTCNRDNMLSCQQLSLLSAVCRPLLSNLQSASWSLSSRSYLKPWYNFQPCSNSLPDKQILQAILKRLMYWQNPKGYSIHRQRLMRCLIWEFACLRCVGLRVTGKSVRVHKSHKKKRPIVPLSEWSVNYDCLYK